LGEIYNPVRTGSQKQCPNGHCF